MSLIADIQAAAAEAANMDELHDQAIALMETFLVARRSAAERIAQLMNRDLASVLDEMPPWPRPRRKALPDILLIDEEDVLEFEYSDETMTTDEFYAAHALPDDPVTEGETA